MSTHSWAKQSSYVSDWGLNFCIQYAVADVFSYKNEMDAFASNRTPHGILWRSVMVQQSDPQVVPVFGMHVTHFMVPRWFLPTG